ncbi:purine and uridine phosphorylase [Auriculariales sp. MPI-PUGE-AT-0066]|nr:purine and uridine phosphorylase [Auriculariales sp. MPI-PUGE-AT-0066]
MKDVFSDANFPKTGDQRVYHLGIRTGDIANRVITVGHPTRARNIAKNFDGGLETTFKVESDRGFVTFTGRYNGVPVSVIAIGMGFANMDFMVREARECVQGEMAIVRLGSCGGLLDVPVGSLAIPRASVAVTNNYDFDWQQPKGPENSPYRISRPVDADANLHAAIVAGVKDARPAAYGGTILDTPVNASADSFYSSQGRQTTFPDHNEDLIESILKQVSGAATLEMETFQLMHLARRWSELASIPAADAGLAKPSSFHPSHDAARVIATDNADAPPSKPSPAPSSATQIRAAAVHMIFASRLSQQMITPEVVVDLEEWSGLAVLQALSKFPLSNVQSDVGAVWEKTAP